MILHVELYMKGSLIQLYQSHFVLPPPTHILVRVLVLGFGMETNTPLQHPPHGFWFSGLPGHDPPHGSCLY